MAKRAWDAAHFPEKRPLAATPELRSWSSENNPIAVYDGMNLSYLFKTAPKQDKFDMQAGEAQQQFNTQEWEKWKAEQQLKTQELEKRMAEQQLKTQESEKWKAELAEQQLKTQELEKRMAQQEFSQYKKYGPLILSAIIDKHLIDETTPENVICVASRPAKKNKLNANEQETPCQEIERLASLGATTRSFSGGHDENGRLSRALQLAKKKRQYRELAKRPEEEIVVGIMKITASRDHTAHSGYTRDEIYRSAKFFLDEKTATVTDKALVKVAAESVLGCSIDDNAFEAFDDEYRRSTIEILGPSGSSEQHDKFCSDDMMAAIRQHFAYPSSVSLVPRRLQRQSA